MQTPMKILDPDDVCAAATSEFFEFKLIANEHGAILLPTHCEHKDAGEGNIRYADNYAGNALAAMVKPGLLEFRFHADFSDDRVRAIAEQLLVHPDMAFALGFQVTYQNRTLIDG